MHVVHTATNINHLYEPFIEVNHDMTLTQLDYFKDT